MTIINILLNRVNLGFNFLWYQFGCKENILFAPVPSRQTFYSSCDGTLQTLDRECSSELVHLFLLPCYLTIISTKIGLFLVDHIILDGGMPTHFNYVPTFVLVWAPIKNRQEKRKERKKYWFNFNEGNTRGRQYVYMSIKSLTCIVVKRVYYLYHTQCILLIEGRMCATLPLLRVAITKNLFSIVCWQQTSCTTLYK